MLSTKFRTIADRLFTNFLTSAFGSWYAVYLNQLKGGKLLSASHHAWEMNIPAANRRV
jgi:hypothetical protein